MGLVVKQVEQDLAFVGLRAGERESDRQAVQGCCQVQPQAPEMAGRVFAVAILGPTGGGARCVGITTIRPPIAR